MLQQLLDSGRTLSEERQLSRPAASLTPEISARSARDGLRSQEQRLNLSAEAAAAGQLAASLSAEARKWQGTIDNAGPYQLEQLRLSKATRDEPR